MYEVEVKLRVPHGEVRPQLLERTSPVRRVVQVDTYYDHPGRDFGATDEALRMRRETDRDTDRTATRVTYKGPLVDEASKTRLEHETAVDDGEAMAAALEALGFAPAATVEKEREYFELEGYTVVLDTVTDLGEFVEVERESSDIDAAREGAFDLLETLGLDPGAGIRESYLGMVLDAGNAQ